MKYYQSNNDLMGGSFNVPHIFKLYSDLGYLKPKTKLLDVGCSMGWFVEKCRQNKINAVGIDIEDDLKYDNKTYFRVDLNKDKFPFPDNYFDFININAVIEHLHDVFHLIRECKRVTKKGGVIAISTYIMNWRRTLIFWHDVTHVRPYPPVAVKQLFNMYGLKTVLCEPKFGGKKILWNLPSFVKWNIGNTYVIIGEKV